MQKIAGKARQSWLHAMAEYLSGVLGDDDPVRQSPRPAFRYDVLAMTQVVDYDTTVVRQHAAGCL